MKDNEDIAEFMGLRSVYDYPTGYSKWVADDKTFRVLMYHESWDWLMPVVEKINNLNYTVHIYPTRARFYKNNTDFIESIHPGYSLIEVVYCGAVEFIKWYNTQKTL